MSKGSGVSSRSDTRRTFLLAAGLGAFLAMTIFLGIMQSTRQTFLDEDLLGISTMAKLKPLSMLLGFGTALSFLIAAAWRIRSLMRGEV